MIEASFTRAIHKKLSPNVYAWKVSASYANGIPDAWYSGDKGDLWIEYKYIKTPAKMLHPQKLLSELQRSWLNKRHKEGRRVAVVLGTPSGSCILTNMEWNESISRTNCTLTKPEIAQWIEKRVSNK